MNKSDSELKVKLEACWTCGGEAKISASKGGVKLIVCTIEGCHFNTFAIDLKIWQSRPLEQKLQSENDDLKEGFAESRRKLFALGKTTRDAYALLQGENDELKKQVERWLDSDIKTADTFAFGSGCMVFEKDNEPICAVSIDMLERIAQWGISRGFESKTNESGD